AFLETLAFLVPKLRFGNRAWETPFPETCTPRNRVSCHRVPKPEFGNQRTASPGRSVRAPGKMSPHGTADQAQEHTMNPFLSAWSRYMGYAQGGGGRKSPARRTAGRRGRPGAPVRLECLEDRCVPSTSTVQAALAGYGQL